MKTILSLIGVMLIASACYADAPLWHYTDKATGEERGICYSAEPINNPDWNSEQITEGQKQGFIDLQKQQQEAKKIETPSIEERVASLEERASAMETNMSAVSERVGNASNIIK